MMYRGLGKTFRFSISCFRCSPVFHVLTYTNKHTAFLEPLGGLKCAQSASVFGLHHFEGLLTHCWLYFRPEDGLPPVAAARDSNCLL